MKLGKFKITNRGLYWGLIITFALLYLCVGFVSTLHSITFFHLANTMSLAVLLGLTYEVGQASVLFSILMSEKNKGKYLPWALMFLLTALQVTANVYASFKYMAQSGSNDWIYWQKAILFGVQSSNPEIYQMIISWISGALLPIVALGMTALVAQNMKFMNEENETKEEKPEEKESIPYPIENLPISDNSVSKEYVDGIKKEEKPTDWILEEPSTAPDREEQLETLKNELLANTVSNATSKEKNSPIDKENGLPVLQKPFQINLQSEEEATKEFAQSLKGEKNPRTEMSEIIDDKETDIKNTTIEEDAINDMDSEAERLTPDVNNSLEIHDESAAEKAIQEINESIDKTTSKEETSEDIEKFLDDYAEELENESTATDVDTIASLPKTSPVSSANLPQFELVDKNLKKEIKKRGRPPKDKNKVVEPKKEQELLPKEAVKVPQKTKRIVHPLKLKEKKIKPLKNLKEINKLSKGDEVIALLEKIDKKKQKESITPLNIVNENPQDSILVPPELKDDYASVILDGVEVIDAKAIPKKNLNQK
jgi:hypothetical protein